MNVREFLKYLNDLFPCDDDDSVFEKRIIRYSEILKRKEIESGNKLDYDSMINSIIEFYPYKGFPNFSEIVKHIKFLPEKLPDFKEGRQYIVNQKGYLYEFEEVPPWWENAHCINEFEEVTLVE